MATSGGPVMNRRFVSMLFVAVSSLLWAGRSLADCGTCGLRAGGCAGRAAADRLAQQSSAPQAGGANFVGDDTCTACHETEGKTLLGLVAREVGQRAHARRENQSGL